MEEYEYKLSIVVPVYNMANFIADTLSALEKFEGKVDYEVIVQNAQSTDGTSEIVDEFCNKYQHWHHFNEKDAGQSDAINRGTAKAKGKWVSWICADDILFPDLLKAIEEADDAGVDIVYGDVVFLENNTYYPAVGTETYSPGILAKRRLIIQQPGTFMLKSVWDAHNGVDVDLNWTMDYDLYMRVESKKAKFLRTNYFVSLARIYPEAKTSSGSFKRFREYARILAAAHRRRLGYFRPRAYAVYFVEYLIKKLSFANFRGRGKVVRVLDKLFWALARSKEREQIQQRFAELDSSVYQQYKS